MVSPPSDKEISLFRANLLEWFHQHKRDLPWRRTRDSYAIWISEVMLQQTRVATVIPYFTSFMRRYPTLEALATADPERLLKVWEGLGYYRRLLNARKTAILLTERGESSLPESRNSLLQLPGIGSYIASAVCSIAYGHREAVVDGNVKRVMARLFTDPFPVNGSSHRHYQPYADLLLDPLNPGDANQAIMELGALVCTPARLQCPVCPVSFFCKAFKEGATGLFPVRNTKKKVPLYHIACAAVVNTMGKILVTKRPDSGMLPGFWEFPGGKCEKGESNETACIREVYEETGLTVTNLHHLCTIDHAYSHFRIRLTLFACPAPGLEVHLAQAADFRWISSTEMKTLAFPAANRKCMPALLRWLQNLPDSFFFPPCGQSG